MTTISQENQTFEMDKNELITNNLHIIMRFNADITTEIFKLKVL